MYLVGYAFSRWAKRNQQKNRFAPLPLGCSVLPRLSVRLSVRLVPPEPVPTPSFSRLPLGVAALTCEATRASTSPFDAVNFDVRPHRGQIACAERLRLMLEGSKSVNPNKVRERCRL